MKLQIQTIISSSCLPVFCSVKNRDVVENLPNTPQEQKQKPHESVNEDGFTLFEEYRGMIIHIDKKKQAHISIPTSEQPPYKANLSRLRTFIKEKTDET